MGTKFSTAARSGYNASPPSDDGAVAASNQVNWAKHKTKLTDPIATQIDTLQANLDNHFNEGPDEKSTNYTTVAGDYKKILNITAGVTVSLASVASVFTGYRVYIYNSHSAVITVDLASATDSLDGVVNGSQSVEPNQAIEFIASASGNYISLIAGVDLTSAQTISGSKTFTGDIVFQNSISPPRLLLDSGAISGSASVDFNDVSMSVNPFSASYDFYKIRFNEITPSVDGVIFQSRVGTSNTYLNASNTYAWNVFGAVYATNPVFAGNGSAGDTEIQITGSGNTLGSGAGEKFSGEMLVINPFSSTNFTHLEMDTGYVDSTPSNIHINLHAIANNGSGLAGSHNSIQFFMSGGNIASGRIRIYGLSNGSL